MPTLILIWFLPTLLLIPVSAVAAIREEAHGWVTFGGSMLIGTVPIANWVWLVILGLSLADDN